MTSYYVEPMDGEDLLVVPEEEKLLRRLAVEADAGFLFLDWDGVLNHDAFHKADRNHRGSLGARLFDPACIDRLNHVVCETEVLVVVSSSWRTGRTVDVLQKILDDAGFEGTVVGRTPLARRSPDGALLGFGSGGDVRA